MPAKHAKRREKNGEISHTKPQRVEWKLKENMPLCGSSVVTEPRRQKGHKAQTSLRLVSFAITCQVFLNSNPFIPSWLGGFV